MATKNCAVCGQTITDKPSRLKKRQTCSVLCRSKLDHTTGRKRSLKPATCPVCLAIFRPRSHLAKFCSKKCKNQAHSHDMTGESNPNFKDGKHLHDYRRHFKKHLSKVMRQGARCWECQTSDQLVVHHIDETRTNDSLGNLAVLCRGCHTRFHKLKTVELRQSMTSRWRKIAASYAKAL